MTDLVGFSIKLFEKIDGWISPQVSALQKRVDALEKTSKQTTIADRHKGAFAEGAQYARGDLLSHQGGLWVALTATNRRPGNSADWKLIVKKGSSQ